MGAEDEDIPGKAFAGMIKNAVERYCDANAAYFHYVTNDYFTTVEFHALLHMLPEDAYRGEEPYTYPPAPAVVQALRKLLLDKNPCIVVRLGPQALAHITILWINSGRPVGMGNHVDGDNAHLLVGVGVDGPPRTLRLEATGDLEPVVARLPVGTAYAFDAREVDHEPKYMGKGQVILLRSLTVGLGDMSGPRGLTPDELAGLNWPSCKEIAMEAELMDTPPGMADYPDVMNRSASNSSEVTALDAALSDGPVSVPSPTASGHRRDATAAASPGCAPSPVSGAAKTPSRTSARLRNDGPASPAGSDRSHHATATAAKLVTAAHNVLLGVYHAATAGVDSEAKDRLGSLLTGAKPFCLGANGMTDDMSFGYSRCPCCRHARCSGSSHSSPA